MLLLSIIVVAFSFVPAVVQNYGATESEAWKVASALYGFVWGAYWINALVSLKSRFPVQSELNFLNKLHTYLLHPGAIIMLFLGALGLWRTVIGAVYATALFIMLYMSAYLFLQIITGLMEHKSSS